MSEAATIPIGATTADVRRFISDMLSQMADMARGVDDLRLETALRLLAVETELSVARSG